MKSAAKRLGLTVENYEARLAAGEKWCSGHRDWESPEGFGPGKGYCREWINARDRSLRGRVPVRPETGVAARTHVSRLKREGKLPHPNTLPCTDCGRVWSPGEKRNEYDHYLGYAREHHGDVQAVCTVCHRRRAVVRGERQTGWRRGSWKPLR